jgi:hypothetical protein
MGAQETWDQQLLVTFFILICTVDPLIIDWDAVVSIAPFPTRSPEQENLCFSQQF